MFALFILMIILSIAWCHSARSGKTLTKNDKFLNISLLVSAFIFITLTILPEFFMIFNFFETALFAIPIVMIPWLILVPELRSSLCSCHCVKDNGEGAILLNEQEKPE